MDKILKGNAYDLAKLISIEGYEGFILESGKTRWNCWDREEPEVPYLYDLGMRRILKICRSEVYLILVGKSEVLIWKLEPTGCKISDFLRKKGHKCRIIAEYRRESSSLHTAWEFALHERWAIFSKNGYALQYKGWADYTFYQFELIVLKKGWMVIDGHDIESFHMWNVMENIMDKAESLIEKTLCEPQVLTGKMLADLIQNAGLAEEMQWLRMTERDDEQSSKC